MSKEATICVQLDYVRKFKCDGTLCGSQCCQGWHISIDRSTYKSYKRIKEITWRKKICDNIRINKKTGDREIMLTQTEKCPFLGEDLLCVIQKNLGEEYLSKVCTTYPRQIYKFQKFLECSLTMSCPVAMKLALNNESPLKLEQVMMGAKQLRNMSIFERSDREDMNRYIVDLQLVSIPILQRQNITLWQRLNLLENVMGIVESFVKKQQDIPVADIEAAVNNIDYAKISPVNDLGQVLILFNQLVEAKLESAVIEGHNYIEDVIEALALQDGEMHVSELMDKYQSLEPYYKKYVEKPYAQMLENFVVNTWFSGCYPMMLKGKISDNYRMFSWLMQLTKLYLLSVAVKRKETLSYAEVYALLERRTVLMFHNVKFIEKCWNIVLSR